MLAAGAAAAGAGRMFVLVLDEVDRLLQRGTDDLYRLFMLPHVTGEEGEVHCGTREISGGAPVHVASVRGAASLRLCCRLHTFGFKKSVLQQQLGVTGVLRFL